MTLSELKPTEDNHFVAMQYYWLIMNRTYLVILTDNSLLGIVVNGLVSIKSNHDPITAAIFNQFAVNGDLNNPYSYVKDKYVRKVKDLDLDSNEILSQNKANFKINYRDILDVRYSPKKKWGMGYYPHDGKVYVKTMEAKTQEFIILGKQSGNFIQNAIRKKIQPAAIAE